MSTLSGTIMIEWNAAGHLNIKASMSMNSSENKKLAIEKLLDAARAVNNQGTSLVLPDLTSTRVTSANR